MGLSGIFLKRRQEIEYPQIMEDVIQMVENIGYIHRRCERYQGTTKGKSEKYEYDYDYFTINIIESEHSEKEFLMYVEGKEDGFEPSFDWIRQGADLYRIIYIENFQDCEDMLLRFAHEYLNKFPNDIFWDDLNWYYTKEDIDEIMKRPFDKDWCYKNPKDFL